MPRPTLILYLDVVSPFAYLAFYVVNNNAIFKDCDVQFIPVSIGAIMKTCGNTAPLYIKNKKEWVDFDRVRSAARFNIPLADKMPDPFPVMTIHLGRALCMLEQSHPAKLPAAFGALYHTYFVDRKSIDKPEVHVPALTTVLGESLTKEILQKATTPEGKAALQKNTARAVDDGAFGLPWYIATNKDGKTEKYWGFDHLGQVVDHLGLVRPPNVGEVLAKNDGSAEGWRTML